MKKLFKFGILILVIVGIINLIPYALNFLFPSTYKRQVEEYSLKYGIDKNLIYSVIKAESNFNKTAHSTKGAKGLMQLMDETAAWCSKKGNIPCEDIYNISTNIEIGTYYLSYLFKKYDGDETLAIAAYNAGQGRVDKWLSDPEISPDGEHLETIPFEETDNYIKKINFYKKIYSFKDKYAK